MHEWACLRDENQPNEYHEMGYQNFFVVWDSPIFRWAIDGVLEGEQGEEEGFFFFAAVVGACRQRISQIYRSKVQAVDKEPRKLGAWNMGAVAVKWCSGEEKRGRTYSKDVGFTQRRLSDR